jgi:SAM-dependent methyltransferase
MHTDFIREFFKKWPALYYFIAMVFGPVWYSGIGPKKFLETYFPHVHTKQMILNLGSGPKVIRPDIVNVDAHAYETVSVVADLHALPFGDGSVQGIISETVIEHTVDPKSVVAEMHRVLSIGGIGYMTIPFLYPFHASPNDYMRWTHEGVRILLSDFEIVEIGVRSGIFSVLNEWLCYVLPSFFSFGNDRIYWLLVNLSLLIFFPVKCLDFFACKLPFAHRMASIFYCVFKKVK